MQVLVLLHLVVVCFVGSRCEAQDVFKYDQPSEAVLAPDETIRGVRDREEKDFVIGGLFPIHSDSEGQCGEVRQERGLERMEAMLFALDKINADPALLPGLELGYDVRDTCNSETVGLDETIDLIITGSELNLESCESAAAGNVSSTTVPTSGIVGAASSRVSVPVASLARLFRTPQVSYASSSALLSDRTRYGYFHRTVPPDDLQARAMVDILLHFNWTYVSVIFSQDTYGQPGIEEFQKEAAQRGICIDLERGIPPVFSDEEYDQLVQELVDSRAAGDSTGAAVVIVFANQETVREVLTRINDLPARRRFVWIASDAWARSIDLVHNFNDTAAGLFGVAPLTKESLEFQTYFSQLTINSNIRNHWFPEFFAAYANCTLDVDCVNSSSVTSFSRYQQGNFIPLVIDATYTFAHVLHNFLVDNCNATDTAPFLWFRDNRTCLGQSRQLNGSALLEYLMTVNFTSPTNNSIAFDEFGNVAGMYEILNYQAVQSSSGELSYRFETVGTWDSMNVNTSNAKALQLQEVEFQFGLEEDNSIKTSPPSSHCGLCQPGEYIRPVPGSCCSLCEPCVGQNYSDHYLSTECSDCMSVGSRERWGNNPFSGSNSCVVIPEVFVSYSDPWAIPSLVIACIGIVCVVATAIIFGLYWKTPVVKSSGREQMVLLLIGISCSFLLAFFYLAPPSIPICLLQRLGLWFCYSLMFGALTVKVIRVARFFYGMKHNLMQRPRLATPGYQIAFTCAIVAGQMVVVIISLIIIHPETDRKIRLDQHSVGLPQVVVTCTEEHIAMIVLSLLYESVLIVVSTVVGVLSFKFPANFNEAKYISFCTFALLIVWVGLIPAYFVTQSQQEVQDAVVSIFVSLSAFAMLIFIFGPKHFIILFQPDKNVHTTTSRCMRSNNDGLGTESGVKSTNKKGKQEEVSEEGKGRVLSSMIGAQPERKLV